MSERMVISPAAGIFTPDETVATLQSTVGKQVSELLSEIEATQQARQKHERALNDAIVMSVAKAPDARFQTAKAFRNALSNSSAPATLAAPDGQVARPAQVA